MNKVLINLIALTGVFFALGATAQMQYSKELWISTNATGNMYPSAGTLDNPLDGSTEAKFDANMSKLPEDCVIHILAGTYETWGGYAWAMQTGQKILGSGRDNTILQLPYGTPQGSAGTSMIYSVGIATNVEVADLSLDCNWQGGGYTYGGISINGTGNIVRRVRVIHCGYTAGVNSESCGIGLGNNHLPMSQGNIIEDCEVSEFSGGPAITAIGMCGSPTNYMTGIIRNNVVILPGSSSVDGFGINGNWVSDMQVEGNYVYGALHGVYADTGGWTDVRILNNTFRNCFNGVTIFPVNTALNNLTAAFNKIDLAATNNYIGSAFNFSGANWTNIFIFGNTIDLYNAGSSPSLLMSADNVTGLVFENNFVDSQLANNQLATPYFTNVKNLTIDNNYDLFGNHLSALNTATLAGNVAVSTFGSTLMESAGVSAALTSLGLPGNPQEVVTNDQSGLTLGGAFSGNGSGLTNLNWNSVTGAPTFARYSDLAPTFTNGMNINAGMAYKIGGINVLWTSNSAGNFVAGNTAMNVVPNGIANTIIGESAMQNSTNASNNTMVGNSAGLSLLSSSANTMVGKNAGMDMTHGSDNVIVGYQAGYGNGSYTNGNQNTLIGDSSLSRARTGDNNLALGYMAGSWLYAGSNNVFIAHEGTSSETNASGTIYIGDPGVQTSTYLAGTVYAGSGIVGNGNGLTNLSWNNVTGLPPFARYSDLAPTFTNGMNINAGMAYKIGGINVLWTSNSAGNFVAGNTAMNVVPNGIANTIIGESAMQNSTNASNNTMVGNSAGLSLLSSSANTMVGKNAGMDMTHGSDNVIVGYQAGYGNGSYTNGNQNTLIGDSSLSRARTGDNNLALGYMAGSWLYAGSNNVFIAHEGTSSETNASGTIYIGDPGVQTSTYLAGTVYAGSGIVGNGNGLTNLSWNNVTGLPPFARYSDLAPTFTNGMNINAGMAYKIGGINVLWTSNSAGNFVAGNTAMNVVPNGIANTIIGESAMQNSTNASNNTMVGNSAGLSLLSSSANTMVGKNAGMDMTHGSDNVIVGYQAGYGNGSYTNGNQNTLIGDSSLSRARTGDNNLALGYMAGSWLYAGSNNVFIAHEGTSSETNANGTIYIGDPGVQTSTYLAGTVYAGSGIIGASLIATNGFQCSTNYTPSLWTPVPGSVIFRASNNWMYAISQYSTNAAFKIGP